MMEKFLAGELSWSKLRVILKWITPETEGYWLGRLELPRATLEVEVQERRRQEEDRSRSGVQPEVGFPGEAECRQGQLLDGAAGLPGEGVPRQEQGSTGSERSSGEASKVRRVTARGVEAMLEPIAAHNLQ